MKKYNKNYMRESLVDLQGRSIKFYSTIMFQIEQTCKHEGCLYDLTAVVFADRTRSIFTIS